MPVGKPQAQHHDDDGGKLQQDAPAHEVLRAAGGTATHHVPQAQKQDDGYGAYGNRHELIEDVHWSDALFTT